MPGFEDIRHDSGNMLNSTEQDQQKYQHYPSAHRGQRLRQMPFSSTRAPPVDIYDTPDSFRINVALPGIPPKNIRIDYQFPAHELTIDGGVPSEISYEKPSISRPSNVGSKSSSPDINSKSSPHLRMNSNSSIRSNSSMNSATSTNTATSAISSTELFRREDLKVGECWPSGTKFSRRIKLPASSKVDGSKVTADLKYGMVYIRVPKVLE